MSKGNEEKLADKFLDSIRNLGNKYKIEVDTNVKVLCDFTCVKEKHEKEYKLGLGFAEVDLAIYKKENLDKEKFAEINIFKLMQDSKSDKKYLNVPFVILELKSGRLTSDGIRARDVVADKIRQIFPFCSYIFIAENTDKMETTVLRQGKSFTNYYTSKMKLSETDIGKIIERFIKPHLDNLVEMKKIS